MEANVPPQPPMLTRNAVVREQIPGGETRGAFQAELARLGLEGRSDVEVSEQRPPEDVAALMGIPTHELAVTRSRHMYASDFPVELATSWLPADIVGTNEELYDADPGPGGIYSRLAELGYGPVTVTETVRLRLPDDGESRLLRLNAEQRVYAIRRTATDETGRVVEVDDSILPAHQWELVYTWPAETPALARKRPPGSSAGRRSRCPGRGCLRESELLADPVGVWPGLRPRTWSQRTPHRRSGPARSR